MRVLISRYVRFLILFFENNNESNSLKKLKSQAMLFDDKNMLNWLINSDAIVAIVPYSLCSKYLKISDCSILPTYYNEGLPKFLIESLASSNIILTTKIKS